MEEVVVVRVAGEGGGVTILGRKTADQQWEFRRATNDTSWAMLDDEEGGPVSPPPAPPAPAWTSSWAEAVSLLDRYPWAQLVPLSVHPEFRADVLVEVTRRLLAGTSPRASTQMDRWLAICSAA